MQHVLHSVNYFIPEIFLLVGAFYLVFVDLFVKNKKVLGILALIVIAGTLQLAKNAPAVSQSLFFGFFTLDPLTHYFRLISLVAIAFTIAFSLIYKPLSREAEGEYYSLFLFMGFALILMAGATNLLMIFMAIEFVSILSYLLTGFLKKDPRSKEAAIKYFLFGSLASGTMLYGMSLLFGLAGSLELSEIQKVLYGTQTFHPVAMIAMLFVFGGLGFKISMAPFHMWAPDVYEAAPTPVSGFLTVAPKALGFVVLLRFLVTAFAPLSYKWQPALIIFAILTMTTGNLLAIAQTNIKRLLAYSSIAQAGYILMGLACFNEIGLVGILIYLLAYLFTNLGAFGVIVAASNQLGNDELQSYAGLGRRAPFLAAAMTLFLLSLAGLPPFAGFIGKFYVFSASLEAGFFALAIIAVINSAVAAFYYFKIVRMMYLVSPMQEGPVSQSPFIIFTLSILIVCVILIGIAPEPFIHFVKGMLLV